MLRWKAKSAAPSSSEESALAIFPQVIPYDQDEKLHINDRHELTVFADRLEWTHHQPKPSPTSTTRVLPVGEIARVEDGTSMFVGSAKVEIWYTKAGVGKQSPSSAPTTLTSSMPPWNCDICGQRANTLGKCSLCGSRAPAAHSSQRPPSPVPAAVVVVEHWKCPICEFINGATATSTEKCNMCGCKRPRAPEPAKEAAAAIDNSTHCKFAFKQGSEASDRCLELVRKVLKESRSAAITQTLQSVSLAAEASRPAAVGVAGLMDSASARSQASRQVLSSALSDINSLMSQAKNLVGMSNVLIERLQKQQQRQSSDGAELTASEADSFRQVLLQLGVQASIGPTSSKYHVTLLLLGASIASNWPSS